MDHFHQLSYNTEMKFLNIFTDKIRDLLKMIAKKSSLKVKNRNQLCFMAGNA